MGVAYFFSYIYRKYNSDNDLVIDEMTLSKFRIGHLFLDYNSMIHPCSQQLLSILDENKQYSIEELDNMIIDHCINYTRYVMDMINAKNVYIMVDGVAPRAKINQQRSRRYKSRLFKKTEGKVKWDSNKITPGTFFMTKLKKKLEEYIVKLKNEGLLFNISIDFENGEGEHKMMHVIKDLDINNNDKICIYGLDADLIMLSLMNKNCKDIILIRDTNKENENKKFFTYLNVKSLEDSIIKEINSKLENVLLDDKSIIYDYIVLCMLLGNDFLEHIPSLMIKENGLNTLIKIYIKVIQHNKIGLVNIKQLENGNLNDAINLNILRDILNHIGNSENYFYNNIYSVYKGSFVYKDVDLEEYKDVYFYKEDCIKYNVTGYKKRYYIFYGINDINDSCKKYIEGLYWVLGYYNGHMHDNWMWYYPYDATPFASDISEYLKGNYKIDNIEKSDKITSKQQLFMVLPIESLIEILNDIDKELLEKIKRFMNMNMLIKKYFPDKVCIDIIHKEYLWQSKIFLEEFNMSILDILI